jgi:putative Ca2+/H+ antiporter (TMEM165/GDT1 family)
MSETSFPIRPKSFDRHTVTRNRRRWIIVIVVALIIVTMVAVLVGIGMGKFMNGKERSEME